MIGLATNEATYREGARQFSFVAPTRRDSASSSPPKATWTRILGWAVGFLIFASYAACREEHRSCAAEPSCSSSASTTVVQEPQASLNPQQEGEQQASGSIAGTIADPTGAPVPRAVAKLTCAGQTLLPQAITDEDERFVSLDVAPGEFRVTISAEGFQTLEVSGTVHPDEHYLAAPITLSIGRSKRKRCSAFWVLFPTFIVSYFLTRLLLRSNKRWNWRGRLPSIQ